VRPRVPVAARLLLAASPLLVLPWTALALARAVRRQAVAAQGRALAASAAAVAAALDGRPGLFPPAQAPGAPPALRIGDLPGPIALDGLGADWADAGIEPLRLPPVDDEGAPPPFSATLRLGARGGAVYLLAEVRDLLVVPRGEAADARGDRLEIAAVTADDDLLRLEVDAAADGPVSAWLVRADGSRAPDNRVEGFWRSAEGGYAVELRLPRTLVGKRLAIAIDDVEDPATRATVARLATSSTASRDTLPAVVTPSPATATLLAGLAGATRRLWLVDDEKHVVASAGSLGDAPPAVAGLAGAVLRALGPLARTVAPTATDGAMPDVSRALAGEPASGWRTAGPALVLAATHPVRADERPGGAVLLEERAEDPWAADGGRLAGWLASFLAAGLAAGVVLVAGSARLSRRLGRLSSAVERLAEADGALPDLGARDEVGDLSRRLAALAARQREHTTYLEQLGRRLSHEMRTPVGVVGTSLDNLRLAGVPAAGQVYLDRADEGVRRLSLVLARLGEATRLEQSLAGTDREVYDLVPVVRGCVEGYRAARPDREIVLRSADGPLRVSGSPELLAQLLDKVVDNALGFAREGTPVEVDVAVFGRAVALSVRDEGPPLPAEMAGRLFDSLVSVRPSGAMSGGPHLGLGLAIVRLVAEFHGGTAAAHDRPDGRGVIVTATLPLA
jgi:two-component system sensor histidine kinase ChvG